MPFGIILSLIAANYITPYVIRGGGHVIDDILITCKMNYMNY